MRGGITLYAVGKIPPLPSCLAPPECCRSVPNCVPDDTQSHINKGRGNSIRGCYASYFAGAGGLCEMLCDAAACPDFIGFTYRFRIPADTRKYLQFPYRFRAANHAANHPMQITMKTRQIRASASRGY